MRCLALLVIPLLVQDPSDKVRALVNELGSDEIEKREAAARELVNLGPSALPAIRGSLDRASATTRDSLQKIILKIEHDERAAKLLRPGPTVTLSAKDRPAAEVLPEVSRQAGVPVEGVGLPEGTLFSLEAVRLTPAQAIDDLCRRHGRVMYAWTPSRALIKPLPYRSLSAFDAGPFRFIVDRFERTGPIFAGDDRFVLEGGLVAPPGRFPLAYEMRVDEAVDDQKTALMGFAGAATLTTVLPRGTRVSERISWESDRPPAMRATRLVSFRGSVRMIFSLDSRRLATLKDPLSKPEMSSDDGTISLKASLRTQGEGRFAFDVRLEYPSETSEANRDVEHRVRVALHDARGRRLEGRPLLRNRAVRKGASGSRVLEELTMIFDASDGFVIESLDVVESTSLTEVIIPFDLAGSPLP